MTDTEILNNSDPEPTTKESSSEIELKKMDITKADYKDKFDVLNAALNSLSVPLEKLNKQKKGFKDKRNKLLERDHVKIAITSRSAIPYELFELLDQYVTDVSESIIQYQILIIRHLNIPIKIIEQQLPQIEMTKQMTEAMKSVEGLFNKYEKYMDKNIVGNNANILKQIENEQIMSNRYREFFQTTIEKIMSNHEKNIETLSKGLIKMSGDIKDIKKSQITLNDIKTPDKTELERSQLPNQGLFEATQPQNEIIPINTPIPTKNENKDGITPVYPKKLEEITID